MEFKQLEIRTNESWWKRKIFNKQFGKVVMSFLVGTIIGFVYYMYKLEFKMDDLIFSDAFNSAMVGGFFGVFITNSPCARGKC